MRHKESKLLAEIDRKCFAHDFMTVKEWDKVIDNLPITFYYSYADNISGKVVGIASIVITSFNLAYLYSNAVLPEYRRQGRGQQLLLDRVIQAKAMGIRKFQAHTRVNNIASGNLLRKNGFKPVQYCPDFYDEFQDGILWELNV